MSRIGLQPVTVPKGVTVTVEKNVVHVKGSKGELSQTFDPLVEVVLNDNEIQVSRINESKQAKSMHGLYRSLLNNMVTGVSEGFKRTLVINGVGYRAEATGKTLVLNLGYSNPIEYVIRKEFRSMWKATTKLQSTGSTKLLWVKSLQRFASSGLPNLTKARGSGMKMRTSAGKSARAA
jgi:large subunit ribosomal protein L6